MLKKSRLNEKLKKLKIEGASESISPVKEVKTKKALKGAASREKVDPPVKEVMEEPLLTVKKAQAIAEKKPEEFIDQLIEEKRTLSFINDLAIPAQKLSKLFKIETQYTEVTLNQLFTSWKDPNKIIKWTVKEDKHGKEFYSLKGEGLLKMKDNPPIYGMEFEDGALISTHMGDYTFIMGCYNFDVKTLVKIFAYGVENAKSYDL